MELKLKKTMVGGKWLKVNGEFIESIGHFAYDGCHKIYILQSEEDVSMALKYGYYLYPIEKLQDTYEDSCPLKFIETMSLKKTYVPQCEEAVWEEVQATEAERRAISEEP